MIKNKQYSFILRLYAFQALYAFMPIYAYFYLYMQDNGMSANQISLLLAVWFTSNLLFRVPIGSLADKFKRKNLLVVGQICYAVTFSIWILLPNFLGFAIGFIFWALRDCLNVGLPPLLYSQLQHSGSTLNFSRYYGHCLAISQIGMMCGLLLAPLFFKSGYMFLLVVAIVVSLIGALLALLIPELTPLDKPAETYWQATKKGVRTAFTSRRLRFLILTVGLFTALVGTLEEQLVLYSTDVGWSKMSVAYVLTLKAFVLAVASWYAHRWYRANRLKVTNLFALSGLALVLAGYVYNAWSVVLVIGFFGIVRLLAVVGESKIQDSISVGERATITSVYGLVSGAQSVFIQVTFGLVTAKLLRVEALSLYGAMIVLMCVAALFILRHINTTNVKHL